MSTHELAMLSPLWSPIPSTQELRWYQRSQYHSNIDTAVECGDLAVVEYLVAHGADIHAENDADLRHVAYNGDLAVVEYLVAHDADIHAENDAALRYAAENGHFNVVEYLVAHGADIHAGKDEALRCCV